MAKRHKCRRLRRLSVSRTLCSEMLVGLTDIAQHALTVASNWVLFTTKALAAGFTKVRPILLWHVAAVAFVISFAFEVVLALVPAFAFALTFLAEKNEFSIFNWKVCEVRVFARAWFEELLRAELLAEVAT